MPVAGPAEPARELLRAAVLDEATVARFRAKTVGVSGSSCLFGPTPCPAVGTGGSGSAAQMGATSS